MARIHRVRDIIGHFLQMSLQLLVKLAENNLYHNESYEASPPCSGKVLLRMWLVSACWMLVLHHCVLVEVGGWCCITSWMLVLHRLLHVAVAGLLQLHAGCGALEL